MNGSEGIYTSIYNSIIVEFYGESSEPPEEFTIEELSCSVSLRYFSDCKIKSSTYPKIPRYFGLSNSDDAAEGVKIANSVTLFMMLVKKQNPLQVEEVDGGRGSYIFRLENLTCKKWGRECFSKVFTE